MTILTDPTGALLIGTQDCPAEGAGFSAWNPATGAAPTPTFGNASPAQAALFGVGENSRKLSLYAAYQRTQVIITSSG